MTLLVYGKAEVRRYLMSWVWSGWRRSLSPGLVILDVIAASLCLNFRQINMFQNV
ncbi:MAG: hypothetical protein ACM37W_19875 [Actinomycetota bacterium]